MFASLEPYVKSQKPAASFDYRLHPRDEYELQPLRETHRVHRESFVKVVLLRAQRLALPESDGLHLILYLRDLRGHFPRVNFSPYAALIRDLRAGCKSRTPASTSPFGLRPLVTPRPELIRRVNLHLRHRLKL